MYSNLSNLTSTNEKLFNNLLNTDNELLVGISTQNPLLKDLTQAFLFRFQKSKSPYNLTLYPLSSRSNNNISGEGFLSDESTGYYDSNLDGLYDFKESTSQNKTANYQKDGYTFILNNNFKWRDYIFGLRLTLSNMSTEDLRASQPMGINKNYLSSVHTNDASFNRVFDRFDLNANNSVLD